MVYPFGFALAFALVYCKINWLYVSICYFASHVVINFSVEGLICGATILAIIVLWGITSRAIKKPQPLWLILLVCGFSQVASLYFGIGTLTGLICMILQIILGVLSCYVCIVAINAVKEKRFACLSNKQLLCVSLCILFGLLGVVDIYLFGIDVSAGLFSLIILFTAAAAISKTYPLAALITCACVLSGIPNVMVVQYMLFAAISVWLVPKNKFLAASAVCLVRSVLGLLMGFGILELVPCLVAALIFVSMPLKWAKKAGGFLLGTKKHLISAYFSGQIQLQMKTKLQDMSNLFLSMSRCYSGLVSGATPEGLAVDHLASQLKLEQCETCPNKQNCYNGKDMTPSFCSLILRATQRGRVNLLDVPVLLSSNCNRLPACLSAINSLASQFIDAKGQAAAEDENKLRTALQMQGTSRIFKQFSSQFYSTLKNNVARAKSIKESLLTLGIVCTEAAVLEGANGVTEILAIVRNTDAVSPLLLQACQKVYPMGFERKICLQTQIAGWSLVSFVPMARFELLCGCATSAKTPGSANGDNYQYNKLDDNKYMVAIADGMGHGEAANTISNAALELISGFYKCGMGGTLALDSVNSLLLPLADGKFSTLDVAVVDTLTGEVDFIKMGSSISVIKSVESSQIVGVESLPLGVAERAAPTTSTFTLSCGDVVVLATDGVVDTFASQTEFCNYVNNLGIINMQFFAESILEEAQGRLQEHKDDMTVIAFRLAKKR